MLSNVTSPAGLRPLDHRWQLAWAQAGDRTDMRRTGTSDTWTWRLGRFLRSQEEGFTHPDLFDADEVDDEIHQAFQVHDQPRRRLELEARLLAGQDNETIGQRLTLAPEVVELYARLIFDVRDRLQYRDTMLIQIRGPELADGEVTREQVVHLFAYMRGPAVVDGVLEIYDTPEILALFATDVQDRLQMDPLRLAFEVKLLGEYHQLPVPVRRLLALTLQRMEPDSSLSPSWNVLGDLDLDHWLREFCQTGTWGVPERASVPTDSVHPLADAREISPTRRLRYAT